MKTIWIDVVEQDGSIGCDEANIPEGYQVIVRYWPYAKMLGTDDLTEYKIDVGGEPYMDNIFGHVKTGESTKC